MNLKEKQPIKPLALVVDDDPSISMVICATLKKSGLDTIRAESGARGVELFFAEQPDIVLMDVMMPDMDGFEACRLIRQSSVNKHTQILMVTGLEDTESTQKAFVAGADGFLSKPLNLTMLSQHVQYTLRAGQAFRELHLSRSRFARTQELAKIGNWQVDLKADTFFCSPEASSLLNLQSSAKTNTLDGFLRSVVPEDRKRVKETLENALTKKASSFEYRITDDHGSIKYILNKSEIIMDEDGKPALVLGIIQDVTQLKKAEEEIRFLAFYDGLTGLANRMLFMDRLDTAIDDAKQKNDHFALMFLDLDHFKNINDTLGHHVGDLLLKKVAEGIKKTIRLESSSTQVGDQSRQTDSLISRLGGDEFTILATGLKDTHDIAKIAERVLKEISSVYILEDHEVSVTASIGISVYPEDGTDAEILLKHADNAIYHAKKQGRNTYQFFMESMNQEMIERVTLEKDLKKAIRNNEFVLYYQPQLRMADKKIIGAEALIRWEHPERGMVPPDKFIPLAEETGIILDINQWVLLEACRQSRLWLDQGLPPVRVAVNMSGYRLKSQNLAKNIQTALEQFDINPENLDIEFTENILLHDTDVTIAILDEIKKLNVRVSLDDFGTGYSSLSYLTTFPVDTIKIDRSFIMDCMSNTDNLVVIKAIIAMGHALGKNIIAEGVETKEHSDVLTKYGCDEAQGYYFSRPIPENEFAELLSVFVKCSEIIPV